MPKEAKAVQGSVLIEVPLAEVPPATWRLHINTHLTPEQSLILRQVTAALDQRLARLANEQRDNVLIVAHKLKGQSWNW